MLHAALEAADPAAGVERALTAHREQLRDRRIRVIAIGKAAPSMARAAVAAIAVHEGVVVAPAALLEDLPPPLVGVPGNHPTPGEASLAAGARVLDLAGRLAPTDVVLLLLSGGASALAVRPIAGVSLEDLAATSDRLLQAGLPVADVNAVRRRLDRLKGGRLARAVAPSRVLALLVSDVPGDDVSVIGSGPVSPDASTWKTAYDVLARADLVNAVPAAVRNAVQDGLAGNLEDTPRPDDASLEHVRVEVIASVRSAVLAAAHAAAGRGYDVHVVAEPVTGEARDVGRALGRSLAGDGARAIVQGGETTVTVRGSGRGGRNQEVALGAAESLRGARALVAAIGTDGIDGPTDAAGAVATGDTIARAAAAGMDPGAALARNDAYRFFDALGDLIRTGPTGTNVADVHIALSAG